MNRNVLKKHLNNVADYGLITEIITLYKHIIKKDYSDFELSKKRENKFINMDTKKYPLYLKKWYSFTTGHELNLDEPKRFTEKIQWLKLYGMGDIETQLADKWLVRKWVQEKIGSEYLFDVFGAWKCFEDIPFERLPDKFMLKGNHGSHMNYLVEKDSIDYAQIKKEINRWLQTDYAFSMGCFELQYLNIPRLIIAEKYMTMDDNSEIKDYKFHCFNGKPIFCEVICDRSTAETIDYFDMDWKHQSFIDEAETSKIKNSSSNIEKPKSFETMLNLAKILCHDFVYVRVDLYDINGNVYFGEMTFTPAGGGDVFSPDSADFMLGDMLVLPQSKKATICKKV